MSAMTTVAPSELQLVQACAGGNSKACETIYTRHYRKVYNLCLRMLGNPTEAEDLAQDAFMHLFRKLGSFRGESAFSTWLHRLTVNQVLMHLRKRKVRPEFITEDGELHSLAEVEGRHIDPLPVIDHIALQEAIEQLPRGYREVFLLHDVEGYEHKEIGEILGIDSGTSKSQLHKARLKLRELIRKKAKIGRRTKKG